jgi:hypothetical protein
MRVKVTCGYYPAGHMVYLNVDALKSIPRRSEQVRDNAKPLVETLIQPMGSWRISAANCPFS